MCIALLSTSHPDYALILLSNRDEFLNRPTSVAGWWDDPHSFVLGGRDLHRSERGTWLGITRQGRLAVLTNFREEGVEVDNEKSRGAIVKSYLTASPDSHETAEHFVDRVVRDIGLDNVGGFTLLCGELRAAQDGTFPGLAVVSNRTKSSQDLPKIATSRQETHGLSNSHFGDASWPKVVHGERLLHQAIEAQMKRQDTEGHFVERLFDVLSVDTLPSRQPGESWLQYSRQLRKSIMIPSFGHDRQHPKLDGTNGSSSDPASTKENKPPVGGGAYGTQKQTVVLVRNDGHVKFVERTLLDEDARPIDLDNERDVEFDIEGWRDQERSARPMNEPHRVNPA